MGLLWVYALLRMAGIYLVTRSMSAGNTGGKPEDAKPDTTGGKPDGNGGKPANDPEPDPKDDDGDGGQHKPPTYEDLREARDERAAARRRAEAAETEAADLKRRLDALETKDLGEQEKQLRRLPELEKQVADLTTERDALVTRLADERLGRMIERLATSEETRFADVTDASALLNRANLEQTEDGAWKETSVKRELKRILDAKPHLRASDEKPPAEPLPVVPNPNGTGLTDEVDKAARDRQFTFLRRRI